MSEVFSNFMNSLFTTKSSELMSRFFEFIAIVMLLLEY